MSVYDRFKIDLELENYRRIEVRKNHKSNLNRRSLLDIDTSSYVYDITLYTYKQETSLAYKIKIIILKKRTEKNLSYLK